MDKLLIFPGKTDQGVFTYLIDHERGFLEKTASEYHPTIGAYINEAKPIKGKTQILLTALGAYELWGFNVNGDAFQEHMLAHEGADYGYKTFESHAKIYKHHVNKNPTASFGDVPLSVYNPKYRRVELIVALDNAKAPDLADRIEHGDYPDWSMGCLKAAAQILLDTFETKAVSELKAGDRIINGLGGVSEVDYPHSHPHKGTWYHVAVLGMHNAQIEPTTEEHPWLVIEASAVVCDGNPNNRGRRINLCLPNRDQKKGCAACPNGKPEYKKVWKRAEDLAVGDYVATPVLQGVSERPEDRMAYLMGLYLAEGHITSDGYVELNVSANDGHMLDKLSSLFPDTSIKWNIRDHCENAAKIVLYDKALAPYLAEHAGKGAHTKRLSPTVMLWDVEAQKIFLGAYCDGDGGVYKDAVYFSTCNRALAEQIQMVLLRVGCISSMNVNLHKPSTVVTKDTVEYQTWVGRDSAEVLKGYSFKTQDLSGPAKMTKNQRFIYDGHLWSPITSIDTEECDEPVYNIAVKSETYEEDSYVVNGVALHNCKVPFDICSICGNKAPTRKQYCEHLKYYMARIVPELGKPAFAFNHQPRFFDISQVLIGADRIAKTHMKVASSGIVYPSSAWLAEKMAESKEAAMEKEIPVAEEAPNSQEALKDLAHGIMEAKSFEKSFPKSTLDLLAKKDLSDVMSTLAMLGILPKPQEFQRIILVGKGHAELADQLDAEGACFDPICGVDTPDLEKEMDLSSQRFDPFVSTIVTPFLGERSYVAPLLGRRLVVMIKRAEAEPLPRLIKLSDEQARERAPVGIIPMLALAAGLYAAFARKAPGVAVGGIDKILASHPGLAAALGFGLYATFNSLAKPGAKGDYTDGQRINPDSNDVFGRIEAMKQKPYTKLASSGSAAKRLLLGIPLAYMASGVLQKHRELNPYDSEGRVKSFVRRNPDVVSGALIADAMLSSKGGGTHGLARKAGNLAKSYFAKAAGILDSCEETEAIKVASAHDFLASSLAWPMASGKSNLSGKVVSGLFDAAMLEAGHQLYVKHSKKKQSGNSI
jgi:hypothetical protein